MRSRALLVAAAGAAACEDGARVLLFGDSLTEGLLGNGCRLGPRACFHPYALRLAREFQARATSTNLEFLTHAPDYAPAPRGGACKRRVDVAEAGVSGERVESMIRRLRGLLASRRCVDAVVILAGTNDLAQAPPRYILEHLAQMNATVARACPNATVVSVTLPELLRGRMPRAAATIAAVNDVLRTRPHVVDLYNMTCRECLGRAERDALWDRDGIHLTEAGYDAFGVAVFVALEGILGLGDRRLRGADPPEIRAPPRVLDRPP